MNQLLSTKKLVITAMFTALTLLATSVIKIQTPTFGYIHLGEVFVLLSGILLGPVLGGLAAGIGSGLSDLLGGYPLWAPGTLVIKFLTAFTAAAVFSWITNKGKRKNHRIPAVVIAGIAGEIVMIAGYFFYNVMMIGLLSGFGDGGIASAFTASVAEVPFNVMQAVIGVVLSTMLEPVFAKLGRSFKVS